MSTFFPRMAAGCTSLCVAAVVYGCSTGPHEEDVAVRPVSPSLSSQSVAPAPPSGGHKPSKLRDPSVPIDPVEHQKMLAYVNEKNDPRIVRTTIDDGEGEVVNCVARLLQHGFDRPLKSLPTAADFGPAPPEMGAPRPSPLAYGNVGPRCPDDTVPQLRANLADIERYATLDDYMNRAVPGALGDGHFHAVTSGYYLSSYPVLVGQGSLNYLNYWKPGYLPYGGFSNSQDWLARGFASNGQLKQTLEAGWELFPVYYGSSAPNNVHVWIASALNGYETWCKNGHRYNDGLPDDGCGWITISSYLVPGGYVLDSYLSQWGGAQLEISQGWTRTINTTINGVTVNGWVFWWNSNPIGYYPFSYNWWGIPRTNYTSDGLLSGADFIKFGGEVYDPWWSQGSAVPIMYMGNGVKPSTNNFTTWHKYTAYQRNMMYWNGTSYQDPGIGTTSCGATLGNCWGSTCGGGANNNQGWANFLFFGGVGSTYPTCMYYP